LVYSAMKSNNLKLSLSNKIIFRAPMLSINATLEDSWPILKAAINDSSPTFCKQIEHIETAAEISQLPFNIQFTIWKYFNRAKFRSTPFGAFAGFGTATLMPSFSQEKIILERFIPHIFTDWDLKESSQGSLHSYTKIVSNNSYYILGNSIRYLRRNGESYELSEIPLNETVLEILKSCTKRLCYEEIIDLYRSQFPDSTDIAETLLHLIDIQLLFTDQIPNIIGQDYFDRVGIVGDFSNNTYLLSEIATSAANINHQHFKHLPELVTILCELLPQKINETLSKFKSDFIRKFEMREIPFLIALDPELGISYGGLETSEDANDFIEQLKNLTEKNSIKHSPLKVHLTKDLTFPTPIDLESYPLSPIAHQQLPNTFTALLSDAGTMLCIDSLGGATATALPGRFTIANDEVHNICKSITQTEQKANPDVIFFDIGYQSESHVDNINRRKCIYDYQLSLLDYNTTNEPLNLNDLLISVSGGEIILRSKHLNKRLVPRLSSAYNYSRSDLSVFRLLCDLQHQGLRTNFLPNLQDIIPGLSHYPRMFYKNLIVSREKWKLAYSGLQSKGLEQEEYLGNILKEKKVSIYFRTGTGDQTLLFQRDSKTDMRMLSELLRRNKELLIEEAFLPADSKLMDNKGNPHCCEFMVTLQHNDTVYHEPARRRSLSFPSITTRIIPPGGEWLYFEIYSHPQRADEILLMAIFPFLDRYHYQVEEWFFVRYNYPADHIRLRIRLSQLENMQSITSKLSWELDYYIQNEIISEFCIKTYKRELERYAMVNMNAIEAHFCIDSQFVISLIGSEITPYQKYELILSTILKIREAGIFEYDKFDELLSRLAKALSVEHRLSVFAFKEINTKYKEFNSMAFPDLTLLQNRRLTKFRNSFIKTLKMHPTTQGIQLFADLMHMHVNRFFPTDQRTHEMLVYQYAIKKVRESLALASRRA
ncbi:MAG TPA: thiopeptide-type bacteriocin biosynthesis protein, partial [Pseudosphingobacterium sp.]|nr:thiopeptide-type bacteriocin biosynthesis protein [Pseudosphingobacterium sp.]